MLYKTIKYRKECFTISEIQMFDRKKYSNTNMKENVNKIPC